MRRSASSLLAMSVAVFSMKSCGDLALSGRHSGVDDGKQPHLLVGQADVFDASRERLGDLAARDAELEAC